MEELTHFNAQGRARMVDVTQKGATTRVACAGARCASAPPLSGRWRRGA